ncbi:HdeA/HdeB family chaperone [Roseivivax isoporae]|uniref:BatC protein n=1 Tax=Roseivivax isoporae LMG 25204 TaxID=1449351 RepID=X7FCU5_9RHOB|nr:HdeA/HdeB family chaperone [Roseivivax isoporae]ETX30635.1 BatC protein [Roseivivax isoporae LMG 25204]
MSSRTLLIALAGATMLGGGAALAQGQGEMTCRDFLLLDDAEQGNIAVELAPLPEGSTADAATTTDVEGDVAVGTLDAIVQICEENPEIALNDAADRNGEDTLTGGTEPPESWTGGAPADVEEGIDPATGDPVGEDDAVGGTTADGTAAQPGAETGAAASADAEAGDATDTGDASGADITGDTASDRAGNAASDGAGNAGSGGAGDAGSDGAGDSGSDGAGDGGSDGSAD